MAEIVAHPGYKTVFHKTDKGGKSIWVKYDLPQIDADEAVALFPEEYTFEKPKGEVVEAHKLGLGDPHALALSKVSVDAHA